MGFWAFHVDSLMWSVLLGIVFLAIFKLSIPKLKKDTPSGLQNFAEMCVDFVNDNIKSIFPTAGPLIGAMSLTILVWVFLMNLMDLVPVDYLPELAKQVGYSIGAVSDPNDVYFKVVPTTDPNITMGMALKHFYTYNFL